MKKLLGTFIVLCFTALSANSQPIYNQVGVDSQAMPGGDLIFISGQGSGSTLDNKNKGHQIQTAFKQLEKVVKETGGSFKDIVKINVYLTDMADYESMNVTMREYFSKPYPARSTIGVAMLPHHHRIEVDAIMRAKRDIK